MARLDIEAAVERGLHYLAGQQEADGSFVSFSSASAQRFRRLRDWQTVFVPALMLTSLAEVAAPQARAVRERLAAFLLDQKTDDWSFNYWSRRAPEYQTQAYPNDLDDTFCALAGLYRHDPSLVDEAAMAHTIKLLLAAETSVGGPYRTWLVSADSAPIWLDVDLAVNSNIAYFLSLAGHELPKLEEFLGQAVKNETYASPYYPSPYAFIYYFGRAYRGPCRARLLEQARKLHGSAANDLERALCLSARLRLDDKQALTAEVRTLLRGQRRDGSWPAAAFYADPVKNGRRYYNGAAALTTAFALEALALSQRRSTPLPAQKPTVSKRRPNRQPLFSLAEQQCQQLEPALQTQMLTLLRQQAASSNGPAIIDLPRDFNRSLAQPLRPEPAETFHKLSLANLYGWLAYTVYDDFLDEEGRPAALSAANVAMRYSLASFDQAVPRPAFQKLVRQTFDTIDGANAWEQAQCRFPVSGQTITIAALPRYGRLQKLAERSLGHALPALAVLALRGHRPSSAPFRHIEQALRHYLIVRQLNDDLHDWQADLNQGQISYVVASLLRELKLERRSYPLADLHKRAQRQFWQRTLPDICQRMQARLADSRQAFEASGLLRPDSPMHHLLDELESSLADTLAQQRQTVRFLRHYKRTAAP
ncbi:MAG TPA: hypothetical protein VHC21_02845 [Candidatus Saccharimonadales bacterium]|nr:hypothetical protein [Candidatus Saccharimonadales bacterium]